MLNETDIQAILERALSQFHCVGISLTLTEGGIRRSFNAGYANLEEKRPMTAETILPIGSSSKAFTAAAVCILDDRGLLKLDEPVKTYLPGFRLYDKYAQEHLTVRDLLCHRCGLPRHDFIWYAHEQYSDQDLIKTLPYLKPFASFREKYQYNNLMFATAGHLIEVVSGKPWAQFVAEEIVAPMGAERVSFCVEDLQNSAAAATGYAYNRTADTHAALPYKQLRGICAAGSINASTAQMVKWIDLQLNLGKVGERTVISEKNMRESHTPQTLMGKQPLAVPGNDFESYGLGWMMQRCKGHKLIHHGGNIDGFSAMHFFLPEDGLGASILTNSGDNAARSAVMYALTDLLLGQDWKAAMNDIHALIHTQLAQMEEAREKMLDDMPSMPQTVPNDRLCGVYFHPGYGTLTVAERDGGLELSIGALRRKLTQLTQNSFKLDLNAGEGFLFQFTLGLDGRVNACEGDLEPMLTEPIRFARQENGKE